MHMTDLEARLAQPQGEQLRDELLARLGATELRLRRRLAASVPRSAFADCAAAADAAQAAQDILRAWPMGLAQDAMPGLQFPTTPHRSTP